MGPENFHGMASNQRVRYPVIMPAKPTLTSSARARLYERFSDRLLVNPLLTRKLVSFQASKTTPFYRWLKYKEAFSPELVDYLFDCLDIARKESIHVLDPFAGTGTALTRASARRWKATGIELLPVGVHALHARFVTDRVDPAAFKRAVDTLGLLDWNNPKPGWRFPHLRITQDAFSWR
jgi:site-specific DNA-methyltransferase (cytosine-N4-specific)